MTLIFTIVLLDIVTKVPVWLSWSEGEFRNQAAHHETVRLLRALREWAGDNTALKEWLVTPNPAFGRRTPLTLSRKGEADLLREMVYTSWA